MLKKIFGSIFICLVILLGINNSTSFAQQASLDGVKLLYKGFYTNNISVTSRGLAYGYKRAKFSKGKDLILDFELANVKDPKEDKKVDANKDNGKRYRYGKINSVLDLRVGAGIQKKLYSKEVPSAIEIRYGFSFGASLGILKPIYVEVGNGSNISKVRYNPSIHTQNVVNSRASYFTGISKTTFSPGGFAKYYMLFNYSDEDEDIKALECGVIADVFPLGLEIMANNTPKKFLLTLYISYVFGEKKY